jgi:hypothetical protein
MKPAMAIAGCRGARHATSTIELTLTYQRGREGHADHALFAEGLLRTSRRKIPWHWNAAGGSTKKLHAFFDTETEARGFIASVEALV